jgi:mercuric ion transport protein
MNKVSAQQKTNASMPLLSGFLAAIGSGLCCAGPFVLLSLGLGGAWVSNLTLLEPYRPVFIVAVIIGFSLAGYRIYRPISHCKKGTACAVPANRFRQQLIFWFAALIAAISVTSIYWLPLVL